MKSEALGRRAGACVLLVIALGVNATAQTPVVTGGAGGSSARFSAPAEPIRGISDHRSIDDVHEKLSEFLQLNSELPGSVKPTALSAVAARQNLRALFSGDDSQKFLRTAKDAPQLKSTAAANGAALAYFATGQGAKALACLIVVADRSPQDPAALLNLAAAALAFRQANEALALLAEAEKAGAPSAGSWAASPALRADYLKGYALMLQGEYAPARLLLKRVAEAAPALKEASLTLALVEAKLDEDPRKSYLQGVWRGRVRLMVKEIPDATTEAEVDHLPDALIEGDHVAPAMADLYDVTSGRAGHLRVLQVPNSTDAVRAFAEAGQPLILKDQQEATAFREASMAAQTAFQRATLPKLYKQRMQQLYQRSDQAEESGPEGIRAAREYRFRAKEFSTKAKKVIEATMAEQMAITITYTTSHRSRKEIDEALDEKAQLAITSLSPLLHNYLRSIDDLYAIESQYLHGMLRHIGVPALRNALIAEGEFIRLTRQLEQLGAINQLVPMVALAKPAVNFDVQEGKSGDGEECSDEDAKWTLSVDIKIAEVAVSCKSVSFEVDVPLGPPLVSLSAEVGVELSGSVTAFVGPKGSLTGVGSAKSGLYVTANSEGIQDIGGKIEATASQGIGPVTINREVAEQSVSFFPGPDQGEAPGGLPVFAAE